MRLFYVPALLLFVFLFPSLSSHTFLQVSPAETPSPNVFSHVILLSWDGTQYNHLMSLYNSGNLTNLKQLVNETRLPILKALITDHYTETNYGHPSLLSGMGQGTVQGCPDNITIWENLEAWNSSWVTGSIAGKAKFTDTIFPYAHDDADYWFAADTTANTVTNQALSFIHNYSQSSFFLFVHFREPDYAGHNYRENSPQYDNALIECDNQLGRILSALETEEISDSTAILVSTDHGFQEGGTSHSGNAWGNPISDPNLYTIWIASNRGTVNLTEASKCYWDQNDLAPTIYSLIGFNDYKTRWPYIRGSALWDRAFDTRDIALTNIQLPSNVTIGETLSINITIENQGNYTEIPTITAYYNNSLIGTKTLAYPTTPLFDSNHTASTQNIIITWNTTGLPTGKYTISANASTIPADETSQPNSAYSKNETDLTDNNITYNTLSLSPRETHDVAITNLKAARNWDYASCTINLSITVKNKGDTTETFNAEIRYNDNMLANLTIAGLLPDEERTLDIQWNTTNVTPYVDYTISAIVPLIPDEYNTLDNQYTDGTIRLRIVGDVNGNSKVGVDDLYAAARAFGSVPQDSRWNEYADLNQNNRIGIDDLYIIAKHFGSQN